MSNITDHIKVRTDFYTTYGKGIFGEHKVECMIPLASDGYNAPPLAYMEDLVKAKIVTYFYGNVLRELNDFRCKHGREMEHEAITDLTSLIDRIIKGEITDGKELGFNERNKR